MAGKACVFNVIIIVEFTVCLIQTPPPPNRIMFRFRLSCTTESVARNSPQCNTLNADKQSGAQ